MLELSVVSCLLRLQLNLPFLYSLRKNLLLSKKNYVKNSVSYVCSHIHTFLLLQYIWICRKYMAQWCCHLPQFVHSHCLFWYDMILLIVNFASLGMADNNLFTTIALTFIPCEAQRKVLALHRSQHMPLNAVQQLSFWMIFWNWNELAWDHSLDAICCSHHKYQPVRPKCMTSPILAFETAFNIWSLLCPLMWIGKR